MSNIHHLELKCTNKACKGNKDAERYVCFNMLTDLGIKEHKEMLCEKCAVNLIQWGLAYKEKNKFKLETYMSIHDFLTKYDTDDIDI